MLVSLYRILTQSRGTYIHWKQITVIPLKGTYVSQKINGWLSYSFLSLLISLHRKLGAEVILYSGLPEKQSFESKIPYTSKVYDCLDVFNNSQFKENKDNIATYSLVLTHNRTLIPIVSMYNDNARFIGHGAYTQLRMKARRIIHRKTVVFAGGISKRIDFHLLYEVIKKLPDYHFYFIGITYLNTYYINPQDTVCSKLWEQIKSMPNVSHIDPTTNPAAYDAINQYAVAIIPYIVNTGSNEYANAYVTPMKLWGYLANQLPVVTTNLKVFDEYKAFPVFPSINQRDFIRNIQKADGITYTKKQKERAKKDIKYNLMDAKIQRLENLLTTFRH